jgi:hypothetical protein
MQAEGSSLTMGGSNFAVGYQGGALKSPSAILGDGVSLNGKTLVVSRAGAVIDGVDLRGYTVEVHASNVTVKNSLFNASGFHTIYQTGSASGLVVEYNTFDGQKANNANSDIIYSDKGAATIRNNEFFNLPSDAINTVGGTIEKNYFSGAGYQSGAHADAISIHSTTGPVVIRQNYIDYRTPADAAVPDTNAAIKIVPHFGNINDVTVDGNVLMGGGYTIYAMNAEHAAANIKITNNDIALGHWGDLYPSSKPANFVYSGNDAVLSSSSGGALAPQAPALPQKPAAAPAPAPAPTKPAPAPAPESPTTPAVDPYKAGATMKGTEKQDIMRGTGNADVIYGNGGIDVITASGGNDKLIGGKDKDWLSGQGGNDLFVYASISETRSGSANRDVICDWGFGKDRVDLHVVDANKAVSGNQAFKWVGAHSFTGKAGELRTYFDGKNTVVEGTVDANHSADFQIQINGKVTLAALDFLL